MPAIIIFIYSNCVPHRSQWSVILGPCYSDPTKRSGPPSPPHLFAAREMCQTVYPETHVTYREKINFDAAVASSYIGQYHEAKSGLSTHSTCFRTTRRMCIFHLSGKESYSMFAVCVLTSLCPGLGNLPSTSMTSRGLQQGTARYSRDQPNEACP